MDLHAHVFGSLTGVVNADQDVGVPAGVTTLVQRAAEAPFNSS